MAQKLIYDLIELIGNQNIGKISIFNIKPMQMYEPELNKLIQLIKIIKKRKEKKQLFLDKESLSNLQTMIGNFPIDEIDICGIKPTRMDKEELVSLFELIRLMKLRSKGYTLVEERWKMKEDFILLTFDYYPPVVNMVQKLKTSEWRKDEKCWYVHIFEWPKIQEIFRLTQVNIELHYQDWCDKHRSPILRVTNKGCYLTGITLPLEEIHQITSFPDPNAKHMESYKNGSWDGRVPLYKPGIGFFPSGLFARVLHVLKKNDIKFKLINERIKPTKRFDYQKNVKLRDYQEVALSKAQEKAMGVLQLATGAGKTKTASAIVSEYGLYTIFFVHTKFLLGQAKSALEEVLGEEIGQVGNGIVDIKRVTVSMVQTTIKALGQEYVSGPDDEEVDPDQISDETDIRGREKEIINMLDQSEVVFFDECQFVAAESFYTIANYCNAYYKFGLSATPYRSDKKDLMIEAALGPVIHKINASYLIKRGFLTKPVIHFIKVGRMNESDDRKYNTVYREEISENNYRNAMIVKCAQKLNRNNQSVLVLVQQITHGKNLQEMFRNEGMEVEFVSGEDGLSKRESEVYKLRTKKRLTLIATTIADEGLDVPSLDAVILGGGGKSPSKGMQRVGRAIRVFGEKEETFEIYSSTKELLSLNKNVLILVDDPKKAKHLNRYFVEQKLSDYESYVPLDVFETRKDSILKGFLTKEKPILILDSNSITEDEINEQVPIDSILVSGGEHFNHNRISLLPKQLKSFKNQDEIPHLIKHIKENQNTIILVDETKHANVLKEHFKKEKIKNKYLTGETNTKNLKESIEGLLPKYAAIVVNAQYMMESIEPHNFPSLTIYEGGNMPFISLEKLKKDLRIFTPKKEAVIIDFIDNSKYLYGHSLERKEMFQTEEEFKITGW